MRLRAEKGRRGVPFSRNKNAETALQQIKKRKYPESIQQYTGDILLVGINYDKKTKKHQCLIESYEKQER